MQEGPVACPVEDDHAVSPRANCLAWNPRGRSGSFLPAARLLPQCAFALPTFTTRGSAVPRTSEKTFLHASAQLVSPYVGLTCCGLSMTGTHWDHRRFL